MSAPIDWPGMRRRYDAPSDNRIDAGASMDAVDVWLVSNHVAGWADRRYAVRIAGVSRMKTTRADMATVMVRALHRVPKLTDDARFYVSPRGPVALVGVKSVMGVPVVVGEAIQDPPLPRFYGVRAWLLRAWWRLSGQRWPQH